jgi:hypothetical protein
MSTHREIGGGRAQNQGQLFMTCTGRDRDALRPEWTHDRDRAPCLQSRDQGADPARIALIVKCDQFDGSTAFLMVRIHRQSDPLEDLLAESLQKWSTTLRYDYAYHDRRGPRRYLLMDHLSLRERIRTTLRSGLG